MKTSRSAFTLVEVTLALALVGFCLLALLGLLATGINAQRDSTEETAAMNLASAILADVQTIPASRRDGVTKSVQYELTVSGSRSRQICRYFDQDGNPADSDAATRYLAILTCVAPENERAAIYEHLLIVWPAAPNAGLPADRDFTPGGGDDLRAGLKNVAGSVEVIGALNRN